MCVTPEQHRDRARDRESLVVGMLTNFPSLPLDRIHNMLKMFVSEPPYDKTADQLEGFLTHLVAEEKLVLEGTQYRRRTANG